MKRSLAAASFTCAACLALAGPARAYEVKTTSEGAPLRWPAGQLPVELALAAGPAEVSQADAEAAAVGSITAWQESLNGTEVALVVADTEEPAAASGDGVPSIRWAIEAGDEEIDAGRLAVTHIQYRVSDGAIQDADVIVNAVEFTWTVSLDGCEDAYDLEGSLTHELGHLLGMAHSQDEEATMYATGGPCETLKRDIEPDDRAGIDYLYRQIPLPDAQAGADDDDGGEEDDAASDDGGDDGAGTGEQPDVVPAYGCQAAPADGAGGRDALPLAVIAAGLALLIRGRASRSAHAHRARLRRSRIDGPGRAGLVLLVALGGARPVSAGELRRLELSELSSRAEVVVRGLVAATAPSPGGAIATDSTVVVFECLAGDCPQRLTVRRRGGERAGRGLWVDGEADLRIGDQVVLYLAARDRVHRVVGGVQGALRIEGRGASARAVRDLREHRVAVERRWQAGQIERFDLADVRTEARAARAR